MFDKHPNKENIKFIVLPLIREYVAGIDDINEDIYMTMHNFTKEKCGIEFDFSEVTKMKIP